MARSFVYLALFAALVACILAVEFTQADADAGAVGDE